MSPCRGTVLDGSAIIDFHWLGEWDWLARHFGPLHVSTELLSSDVLGEPEKRSAAAHLTPLVLTAQAFQTVQQLRVEEPGLSLVDRATVALAIEGSLRCATDDDLLAAVCRKRDVLALGTLSLLRRVVETGHGTPAEVIGIVHGLMRERGKWISHQLFRRWEISLDPCRPLEEDHLDSPRAR